MGIVILSPAPVAPAIYHDSENVPVDSEGDVNMGDGEEEAHISIEHIVTPGESVTDDPQWMRYRNSVYFRSLLKTTNTASQRPWNIYPTILHRNPRNSGRHYPTYEQAPVRPAPTREIYPRDR